MERFTHRESLLLGYSPQRYNETSSEQKTPSRNSDVDFRDVFGGPPRQYSIQESRHSCSETTDSNAFREDEVVLSRSPWAGLSEKPVFGEESANRRRYTNGDFYDDIFKGEECFISPRRSDTGPYSSAPGSRVLSPARPLPPKAEPFGISNLPPFSPPTKVTKAIDYPAFGSGNHSPHRHKDGNSNEMILTYGSTTSLSRFSNQTIQGRDDLRNGFRSCMKSHESSLNSKEYLYMTNSDDMEVGDDLEKETKGDESLSNSIPFHFSIYRWASKGVPSLMPLRRGHSLRSREKGKTESCSSSNDRVECEKNVSDTSDIFDFNSQLLNNHTSLNVDSSRVENEKLESGSVRYKSSQSRVKSIQIVDEAPCAVPGSKSLDKVQNGIENVPDGVMVSDKSEETRPGSVPEEIFQKKLGKEVLLVTQETKKPELRPLKSLFKENDKDQGDGGKNRKDGKKKSLTFAQELNSRVDLTKSKKKHDGRKTTSKGVEMDKTSSKSSTKSSENNLGKNGTKGKVQEFVKIFNQEATMKSKIDVETQSQSARWEGTSTYEAYNEASVRSKEKYANLNMPDVKDADEKFDQLEKQLPHVNSSRDEGINMSSAKIFTSASKPESLPASSKDTVGIIDDNFEENFVIKELSIEQDKLQQSGEDSKDHEHIKDSDAKIRQWSKGKEGNIRSLLSTLQYVLWPQSGWKPVALVDIIEGSAVKRSYQRALLTLHPDKLQQKGAAAYQKYIAAKVFDILQEAWDHFNSLGSI